MRSHGLPTFPNPIKEGSSITLFKQHSPLYASASAACRELLPAGLALGHGALTTADQDDYLKAIACLRSRGFPEIPDPSFNGATVHMDLPSTIDQNSAQFRRALSTCRKLIPAGLPYST
jgi:hypothetical protein